MGQKIAYTFTAVPNSRLDYYLATAVSRPPVQTAILLYLERVITGWHKPVMVISVSVMAKAIRATRSATSKALKALCQAGEVSRGELTPGGYPLWLPEMAQDAQKESEAGKGGCAQANTVERVQTNTEDEGLSSVSTLPKRTLKKKEKTQTFPPTPHKGGQEDHAEQVSSSSDALRQVLHAYPGQCTDKNLARLRLNAWLEQLSLDVLLATIARYKTDAEYHVTLECFLTKRCLVKWLATKDNLSLEGVVTPPNKAGGPEVPSNSSPSAISKSKRRPRKQRRPQRQTTHQVQTREQAAPRKPTSQKTLVDLALLRTRDPNEAVFQLAGYIAKKHIQHDYAATRLCAWLPTVWSDVSGRDNELSNMIESALREALQAHEECKHPNSHSSTQHPTHQGT